MSSSTKNQKNDTGSSERQGVRLLSAAAIVAVATGVLAMFGDEGRTAEAGLSSSKPAYGGTLDGWVRPGEIRVRAPVVQPFATDRAKIRIQPVEIAEPPELAPPAIRFEALSPFSGLFVPARPGAVHVEGPDVPAFDLRESLAPSELSRPRAPALRPVTSPRGG